MEAGFIENFLKSCPLFRGMQDEDLSALLKNLGARRKKYKKGEAVYRAGDEARELGVVVCGRIQIENDDLWGNKSVLDSVGPGRVFAETYACVQGEKMLVSAVAVEVSEVLFLCVEPLLWEQAGQFPNGELLLRNLLIITAGKNLHLARRSIDTAPKTIRGRLLSYLSGQAAQYGNMEFSIPFNRQQLADYLNVDRSALSGELGKLRRDGLLETKRNHFVLKTTIQ